MNSNMLLNGEMVAGQGDAFAVLNPATEQTIVEINSSTVEQVDQAVLAAREAFKTWQNVSDEEINASFKKIAQDIRAEKDEIAELITAEQGKPLAMAQFEVEASANWIENIIGLEVPVDTIQEPSGKVIKVYNRPLGVVASITPWNWPFAIAVWHFFPALKTKNTVVNKPSEFTPLSTIKLVEIMNRHLPKGVCNLVLGKGDVGQALSEHALVDKVTFTGSTRTGQSILKSSVDTLKSVVLELGGNDVGIVLEDVDVDVAAEKIFGSAFLNMGQTCAALKRLYVHESVYDALTKKLTEIANAQVIGNGLDPNTTFGPIQNRIQYNKVKSMIEDAVANGGQIITAPKSVSEHGYFIPPTLVTNLKEGVKLVDEEQFGPVLPILKFTDVEDVIQRANNSPFGLGGSVWSKDLDRAQQIASRLETGTVWINNHSDLSPDAEFGGWKMSGLGYSFGLNGMLLYTHKQAIHISQ
ncbi:aldehyde dehydrogenase family protein [Acinetobacter zhairhuonensis]|uniref:aldehyde dehydrogenase family protein n=1 Tax=Acinetobacter sp. A7.4 TaxID=2919921 RepID=UPI001F5037A0|nr:aldehyde dehydrogenase family protein [Acinetobacter sp. A7.4]MCJ8162804.1 aldehyde dehydrogenase family protein [Acinetobacter sp. A7.4]